MKNKLQTINIKEYLNRKGIKFREYGKELVTHCLFSGCDKDSRGREAHLYFKAETGQYDCKKCGEKGNMVTLSKHFGDEIKDIALNPIVSKSKQKKVNFDAELVEACHQALPVHIRQYLNNRGITDAVINEYKLGWSEFYNQWWITIPIKDFYGTYRFFKLRQDPNIGSDKMTFPKGSPKNPVEAQIYGWDMLKVKRESILICEGELDRLALLSRGVPAVTSTNGAMTFKEEWATSFEEIKKIYICYDNDDTGRKGAKMVAEKIKHDGNEVFTVILPKEVGESGDITDYLVKLKGNPDDLFTTYAKSYPEQIDISQFKPLSLQEIINTLGLTIKQDEENKIVTFLCQLSAYTESAQFNISYNAPSSTGKSYIPTETARLFPEEDVMEIGYCSPTAFFHDVGKYDKEKNMYMVDLSRKILIFLDQPHTLLLQHLRPLLSHDKKIITLKITDKNQISGLKTKNVLLKGYPSVIFCTAGLKIDEQEATRFLLLSPQVNQEKIRQGILETIKKESDPESYKSWLEENPERKLLKERIRAIKLAEVKEIMIASPEKITARFLDKSKALKPRNQRDIKRLTSLIKISALINLWWRDKNGSTIIANDSDIEQAFKIWDSISVSQDLNLPPYIYNIYQEVILKAWHDNGSLGLSRQEILKTHFDVYGRMLNPIQLRQQILPMLETAGLIFQEPDPGDKRKLLIYPVLHHANLSDKKSDDNEVKDNENNNSETPGRVDTS